MKKKKRISTSLLLRMGAVMTLLLFPSIFIGQPLHMWKMRTATLSYDALDCLDTIEYKGNLFKVAHLILLGPEQPEEPEVMSAYHFDSISPSKWKEFNFDKKYGRTDAVQVGIYFDCLNGHFEIPGDSMRRQAATPGDTIPLKDGKGKYKKTFRLSRKMPNIGKPVYVTTEVEIDLKKMEGNKIKTTFSTKEGNAEYDILYRYYYRGPKKEDLTKFLPPLK